MNEPIIQEALGLDVAMRKIDCNLSISTATSKCKVVASTKFANTEEGFKEMISWVKSHSKSKSVTVVMEATGVYHQSVAYYLSGKGFKVCIVQPTKAKQYAKSLDQRSKTDKSDARMLAQLGLERDLSEWIKPDAKLVIIRQLTRERTALNKDLGSLKNQLHSLKHSAVSVPQNIKRMEQRIALIQRQIEQIIEQIKKLVEKNQSLKDQVQLASTIPGISFITAVTVLAETDGFVNIHNRRQLVCYVGLDVVQKQSGTLTWKSRISKRGNSYIRSALYMNAVCSTIHNPRIKKYFTSLKEREKPGKTSIIAIERKLLITIFAICKSGIAYDPEYELRL